MWVGHLPRTQMFPLVTFRGSISEVVGFLYFLAGPGAAETQTAISDDYSVGRNGEVYWVHWKVMGAGSLILKPPLNERRKCWVVVVMVFAVISCLCTRWRIGFW